jgi:undecaprenyl-diphosphatase
MSINRRYLTAVAGICTFAALALAVTRTGWLPALDDRIEEAVHEYAVAAPGLVTAFRIITWFGTFPAFVGLSVLVVGVLVAVRRPDQALLWVVAMIGIGVWIESLKDFYDRPRPSFDPPLAVERSYSFPSGHAAASAVAYGLLGHMAGRRWPTRRRWALFAGLGAFVLLIGFSRIFLGVHYLSDILAGYALGLAWLALCVQAGEAFHRTTAAK